MKNFIIRTITGILFVLIIVSGILFYSLPYCILFALLVSVCLYEFYTLLEHLNPSPVIHKPIAVLGGAYFFIASYLYISEGVKSSIFLPYLLFVVYVVISEIYKKEGNPILNIAYLFFGQCYIAISFSLFNLFFVGGEYETMSSPLFSNIPWLTLQALIPLSFFVFIWLNDTGAYLCGITFGKHCLFERISPKKTWEGFLGGAVVAMIAAGIIAWFFPIMTIVEWIGYALTVVVTGTYGDLWESLIKRTVGVKDSGHLLPGHGGALDRLDSVLLAIPAAVLYLYFVIF